jgi:hypothetical protein
MGDVLRFVSLRRPKDTGVGIPTTVKQLRRDIALHNPDSRLDVNAALKDIALLEETKADLEIQVEVVEAQALDRSIPDSPDQEEGHVFRRGQRERGRTIFRTVEPPRPRPSFSLDDVLANRSQTERDRLAALGVDLQRVGSPEVLEEELDQVLINVRGGANALCGEGVPGDFKADPTRVEQVRATLTGLGLADLLKVTETVVGYQVRELADTSNVLPREHWRRRSRLLTESEVERISTQAVRELQSTNVRTSERFELSTETEKTVNTKFSVDAGVDVSTKYGVTKIDASLDVGFARDSTESKVSATDFAQEVVRETVDSIEKSSSETIRRLLRESREELFVKGIDRREDQTGYTGYYFWLDKLHQLQIRSWGTRLMVEFYIVDPSESLLTADEAPYEGPPAPPPIDFNPSDVNALNYLCLAKRYQTSDVSPPPPAYKSVSWSWNSEPDEEADEDAEETAKATVEIPRGYAPLQARVAAAAQTFGDWADWFVDLAGRTAVSGGSETALVDYVSLSPIETETGIDVVVRVFDHHDKTGVVNVFIKCIRTASAYEAWQVATWGAYLEGFQAMQAEYRRAKEQAEFATNAPPPGRPPEINRRLERTEL